MYESIVEIQELVCTQKCLKKST